MSGAQKPHSRLDSEKALLLGLNALRLEVPSPVWEDIYERATAYVKEANSLFEQYEDLKRINSEIVDVNTEACNKADALQEQNESYRRTIENVLLYLQRSQFLVGADALIEDIQAALSNPASERGEHLRPTGAVPGGFDSQPEHPRSEEPCPAKES